MMAHAEDTALRHFLQEIRAQLGERLRRVILFGSRARGDDVSGSDYDCLVVVDRNSPEILNAIDEVTGEILFQHNAVFSVFTISEERHRRPTYDPFLSNVRKEGIVLWAQEESSAPNWRQ